MAGASLLLVLAASALAASAWAWPSRAAYVRARACAADAERDCYVETRGVVRESYIGGGRLPEHLLVLRIDGRHDTEVELADPEEVWGSVAPRRFVAVRLWRGHVTRVAVGGGATETADSPVVEAPEFTAFGLLLLGLGTYEGSRAREMSRQGWRRATVPTGSTPLRRACGAVGVAGLSAAVALEWLDVFSPLALLAIGLVCGAACAAVPRGRPR
jgi:hypothetical protein